MSETITRNSSLPCRVAVIWIDWYPYHVARFRGIASVSELAGRAVGIELVAGVGVHAGLKFREALPRDLEIETLLPDTSWHDAKKTKLARMLWRRLSQLNPEVVLVPGYYTLPAIAAAVWARLHGRASVLMTESAAIDHERIGWKEKLKSLGIRLLFDWALTGGKPHVRYLEQLGFKPDRTLPFYDVVDNRLFREGVSELRSSAQTDARPAGVPSAPYFLYVGRLAPEKNVEGLLRSWLRYRATGGTWPLMIVGDGPEAPRLKEIAARSPHGYDVVFPGLKSSRELVPFYAFAGCFVLPSTREPWGLVVNEAMAAGLPVLASARCGCVPDLVRPGVNGFRFDPEAPDATAFLAARLHNVARLTPQERAAMSQASQDIISTFSPENFGRSVAYIARTSGHRGALQPIGGMQ